MSKEAFIDIWPLGVLPLEDELLSSWLTRNAHSHFQKIYTFYRHFLKDESRIWNIDLDSTSRPSVLNMASKKGNVSLARVHETTLLSYEGSLFEEKNKCGINRWILPLGIFHTRKKRLGLLYCPQCLTNDGANPYFRKKWRLSLSIVCPYCHIWLKDRCEDCGEVVCFTRHEQGRKDVMPYGTLAKCSRCLSDFRLAKQEKAPNGMVEWQTKLYNTINAGYSSDHNYSHLFFDGLYQIIRILNSDRPKSIRLRKALSKMLGHNYYYFKEHKSATFEYRSLYDRSIIMEMALYLTSNWPQNFIKVCKDEGIYSNTLLMEIKRPEQVPYWYWMVVKEYLFVKHCKK